MTSNTTTYTTTSSLIASVAHSYAETVAIPSDMLGTARSAGIESGLTGDDLELFVERAVGHWTNVEAGISGY
jgi:hypothetical protein